MVVCVSEGFLNPVHIIIYRNAYIQAVLTREKEEFIQFKRLIHQTDTIILNDKECFYHWPKFNKPQLNLN